MYRFLIAQFHLVAIVVLFGCAHSPGGFLVQRTQNSYSIFVGGAVKDKENSFFAGAYNICLDKHQSGFKVQSRTSDQYGSIDATVVCEGNPDKFLASKYANRKIKLERSSVLYADGFAYKVIDTRN